MPQIQLFATRHLFEFVFFLKHFQLGHNTARNLITPFNAIKIFDTLMSLIIPPHMRRLSTWIQMNSYMNHSKQLWSLTEKWRKKNEIQFKSQIYKTLVKAAVLCFGLVASSTPILSHRNCHRNAPHDRRRDMQINATCSATYRRLLRVEINMPQERKHKQQHTATQQTKAANKRQHKNCCQKLPCYRGRKIGKHAALFINEIASWL